MILKKDLRRQVNIFDISDKCHWHEKGCRKLAGDYRIRCVSKAIDYTVMLPSAESFCKFLSAHCLFSICIMGKRRFFMTMSFSHMHVNHEHGWTSVSGNFTFEKKQYSRVYKCMKLIQIDMRLDWLFSVESSRFCRNLVRLISSFNWDFLSKWVITVSFDSWKILSWIFQLAVFVKILL